MTDLTDVTIIQERQPQALIGSSSPGLLPHPAGSLQLSPPQKQKLKNKKYFQHSISNNEARKS